MWQKLTIRAPSNSELIAELLDEAGALAVTFEAANTEEIFEPKPGTTPLWEETQVIGLFEQQVDLPQIVVSIEEAAQPHTPLDYSIESIADQDWQKVCMDAFEPLCIADKLWINPSWHKAPEDNKPIVSLDPGLAFGTGAHPTTALCLEWLASNISNENKVIDYGSGSGILAIAALKLGAKECWAVDNDPQALEATIENARRNGIFENQLHAVSPEDLPPIQADVLIANILANPLISLAPVLEKLVKPGGKIVLSGILESQALSVMNAYLPLFSFTIPQTKEEWSLIAGIKSDSYNHG